MKLNGVYIGFFFGISVQLLQYQVYYCTMSWRKCALEIKEEMDNQQIDGFVSKYETFESK